MHLGLGVSPRRLERSRHGMSSHWQPPGEARDLPEYDKKGPAARLVRVDRAWASPLSGAFSVEGVAGTA